MHTPPLGLTRIRTGSQYKALAGQGTTTTCWKSFRTSCLPNFLDPPVHNVHFSQQLLLRSPPDHCRGGRHLGGRPWWKRGRRRERQLPLTLLPTSLFVHISSAEKRCTLFLKNLLKWCGLHHARGFHAPGQPLSPPHPQHLVFSASNPSGFFTNSSNWCPNAKQLRMGWLNAWWNSHQAFLLGPSFLSVLVGYLQSLCYVGDNDKVL